MMTGLSGLQSMNEDGTPQSRFTYRDLRQLGLSSVASPLRVIALVDFDCFYAQCETIRLGLPDDQPLGVQQFQHVIAINYPARAAGLKKVVTAVEAKQKCPNIVLQHVPTWREGDTTWAYREDVHQHMDSDKSSLDYYRLQSRKAMAVVKDVIPNNPPQRIEKAGIDELFLDLSAQVHAILLGRYPELALGNGQSLDSPLPMPPTQVFEWHDDCVVGTEEVDEDLRIPDWDDVALNVGAEVVRNLRAEMRKRLRYTCSAGIARNKVLAKLAAGHNKPNKQTIVRASCIPTFLSTYKFTKLRGLGGKLGGLAVKKFSAESVSDLLCVSLKDMQSHLGPESGQWVYRVIRGIEYGEVVSRTAIKSMASAKTFTPKISGLEQAERWLRIFAADIMGRIEEQEGRRPRTITVHHQINGRFGPTRSRQGPIPLGSKLDAECLFMLSRSILADITREGIAWPCLCLTVSVSDFSDAETASHSIKSFWASQPSLTGTNTSFLMLEKPAVRQEHSKNHQKRTILDYHDGGDWTSKEQVPGSSEVKPPTTLKRQRKDSFSHYDDPASHEATVNDSSQGNYQCPTCSKLIPAGSVLEHLDWHVAVDLQSQV